MDFLILQRFPILQLNCSKWLERLKNKEILLYAEYDGHPISAVLGRAEKSISQVV